MRSLPSVSNVYNPIGIIALFISLIYSMTSIVMIYSNSLSAIQRWFFVVFLVSFPFVVFITFIYLIVNKPGSLYSPKDFRSDRAYEKMNKKKRKIRIQKNIEEDIENEEVREKSSTIDLKKRKSLTVINL